MSENIAGYIDRSYVKGQIYRYSGCPIPMVFTGNINEISDELLGKAMLVADNGNNGNFPSSASGTYLVTTVEYGNSIVLQSCVDYGSSIEYKRIYQNGAWTPWSSPTSDVAEIKNQINGDNGIIQRLNGIDGESGSVTILTKKIDGDTATGKPGLESRVNTIVNTTIPGIDARVSKLESGSLTPYVSTTISDAIANNTYARSRVTGIYFTRVGVLCSLTLNVKTIQEVTSGSDIFNSAPGTIVSRYYPPYYATGSGYYGNNPLIIAFLGIGTDNKNITIRNAGADKMPKNANMIVNIMWTYSEPEEGGES